MTKIRTVEQLAALPDNICDRIMGSVALRQSARDFLKYTREQAPLAELRAKDAAQAAELTDLKERMKATEEGAAAENARLRSELEALSRVINRRGDEPTSAPVGEKRPRGRPPNVAHP
jgi:predicted  nucleic acid-binding Zn-ribbon protein